MQKVLRKARKGTRVVYIPGNHDEAARHYVGIDFGGIAIRDEAMHVTAAGARLLVMHGDRFDGVVHVRAVAGARSGPALHVHAASSTSTSTRCARGIGPALLVAVAVPQAQGQERGRYIGAFEDALAREARTRGFDGVVCGHIHHAEIREIGGMLYCNDGDWVESLHRAGRDCDDGELRIVDWRASWRQRRAGAMRDTRRRGRACAS